MSRCSNATEVSEPGEGCARRKIPGKCHSHSADIREARIEGLGFLALGFRFEGSRFSV